MEVRQVSRLKFEAGYWGPSLEFTGVIEILPFFTITGFADGGGYVSVGWIFWYANIEWRIGKAR